MNYQVLIVDDKPLIRRSLKETIDWKKLNCVVSGEAQNGKEAVEDVRTTLPGYYDAENGWTGGNANDQTA